MASSSATSATPPTSSTARSTTNRSWRRKSTTPTRTATPNATSPRLRCWASAFCPRIRGLKKQRIYHADPERGYGALGDMLSGSRRRLRLDWIEKHWDEIAQLVVSFAYGHTTASTVMQRLVSFGAKNRLYRATRDLGRLFETEFVLEYLAKPELRRSARAARSSEIRGAARAMARSVFYLRETRARGLARLPAADVLGELPDAGLGGHHLLADLRDPARD